MQVVYRAFFASWNEALEDDQSYFSDLLKRYSWEHVWVSRITASK